MSGHSLCECCRDEILVCPGHTGRKSKAPASCARLVAGVFGARGWLASNLCRACRAWRTQYLDRQRRAPCHRARCHASIAADTADVSTFLCKVGSGAWSYLALRDGLGMPRCHLARRFLNTSRSRQSHSICDGEAMPETASRSRDSIVAAYCEAMTTMTHCR